MGACRRYQVRYDKSMSPDKMQLKVMTDGILMREVVLVEPGVESDGALWMKL